MVRSISGLTGNGVKDFIVQRLTAYFLITYLIVVGAYVAMHMPLQYSAWKQLFSGFTMQVATLLCLVSIALHAWIGLWTVFTDYIHCVWGRGILMLTTILALAVYVIWIVKILWS